MHQIILSDLPPKDSTFPKRANKFVWIKYSYTHIGDVRWSKHKTQQHESILLPNEYKKNDDCETVLIGHINTIAIN